MEDSAIFGQTGPNNTKSCVPDLNKGRFPDATCGDSCSPTPPPPKGDWAACGACSCRGTDLSPLNSTFYALDLAGAHEYAFSFCDRIPDSSLPKGCQGFGHNVSLVRYDRNNEEDCEALVSDCGATKGGNCLYGRKAATGLGELELQFRPSGGQFPSCVAESTQSTVTFIMTKGEQANPQRLYDTDGNNSGCHLTARWAGLPENPRPWFKIAKESELWSVVGILVVLGAGACSCLGVGGIIVGDKLCPAAQQEHAHVPLVSSQAICRCLWFPDALLTDCL